MIDKGKLETYVRNDVIKVIKYEKGMEDGWELKYYDRNTKCYEYFETEEQILDFKNHHSSGCYGYSWYPYIEKDGMKEEIQFPDNSWLIFDKDDNFKTISSYDYFDTNSNYTKIKDLNFYEQYLKRYKE